MSQCKSSDALTVMNCLLFLKGGPIEAPRLLGFLRHGAFNEPPRFDVLLSFRWTLFCTIEDLEALPLEVLGCRRRTACMEKSCRTLGCTYHPNRPWFHSSLDPVWSALSLGRKSESTRVRKVGKRFRHTSRKSKAGTQCSETSHLLPCLSSNPCGWTCARWKIRTFGSSWM